jgi:N utilization substance protein A
MLESLQNAIRQNTAQTELPEHVFVEAIEAALRAAARRVYGQDADISVEINLEKGDIRCYVPKIVVNIMRDFSTEIPIEEAKKLQADVELGQMLNVEINPSEFGRIPAQLAKQILFQKIKQAEREKIYQEFAGREGEIVTGYVQRFERGGIILDLEQTEAFLPPREMPRSKTYERGKRLQCLILSVKNEARGAPVIVSRTHRDLLAVLFEQEVPEIYEGQVRIMAVARDPGNRAKVAVRATEEGIDAVGTCVGVKGIRVQTIVSELDDEKIDLLEWSEDTSVFIANALRPAAVRRVELDERSKSARVIVPDNQLSLAIGQRGQNARLAAKLTGWRVDIKGESEAAVSIDELFKPAPNEKDTDITSTEENTNNTETQTEDGADTIISEQSINSEAVVETEIDADNPENDDFDTETEE